MSDAAAAANPFPGLRPFRADEEHLFFGREDQVDAMIDTLAQTRLLAVVGTSGSGKSSLVNCGLIPGLLRGQMARAGSAWRVAVMRPGNRPVRALAQVLARSEVLGGRQADVAGYAPADLTEATLGMSKLGLVDAVAQARLEPRQNLLLVVDQFEELFRYQGLGSNTSPPETGAPAQTAEQATAFVKLLLEAVEQDAMPIWVVLTMRSDFLGECAQFFGLPEAVSRGQYLVPRLTLDDRRAAIAEPLRLSGTAIDAALLTRLVNDVGDNPDQLSILQHALNRTWASWAKAGGRGALTLAHYAAAGTMAHALNLHAEEALEQLKTARQLAVAQSMFRAITDRVTDSRGTRRPTAFLMLQQITGASADELCALIEVFRDPQRCFLMPPADTALEPDTPIDISHETLMRVWERLQQWGNAEAQSAQTYRRLSETAALHRTDQLGLLRQPDLQFYTGWKTREQPTPSWAERYAPGFEPTMAFLKRSEQAERQRLWRLRAMAGVVVVVPTLVAVWIFDLYRQTDVALGRAEAGQEAATLAKAKSATDQKLAESRLGETLIAQEQAEDLLAFLIGENFLEKLRPVGRIDILGDVQDKVQRYLQQAQQADGQRPTALQAAGLAARNAGDMLLSEGKLSQALARFQEAAEIFGKLAAQGAQDPPQPLSASSAPMRGAAVAGQRPASAGEPALQAQRPLQAQAEQARALFRLGDAQFAQGHSTLALATHNRALSLRKQVAAATSRGPQAMDAVIEQSLSHSAVGKVLNDLGRPRDALQELDASLKLLAPLPTAEAQPKLLKALIDAYDNRADALAWLDQVPAKRVAYEQTDRLYADWRRRQPLSAEARQGAVFAAVRRATKMAEQDLLPEALRAFEEGEASMDELVRWDSRNVPWQRDLQGIRLLKAGVQKDVGDFKAARQALDVVLPRFKQMAMADPSDLPRLRDLGWVHQERGLLATAQTQRADAVRDLAAAERFYAKVAAAAPDSAKSKQDWYWSIYNLAVAQRAAGRRAEALAQVRAGQRVVAALMRGSSQIAALPSDQVRYFYVMELQLLKEAGDHARSDAVLRQMQQVVAGALAAARPAGAKLLDAAAVVDSQLAQRATAAGRASEALALRRSGLEKSRRATAQDPAEPLWWDNQAAAASALAEHHAASLRWRDAAAAYREEIVALEQAVKLAPQQLQNTTVAPTTSESAVAAARTPGQDAANDRTPAVALTLGRRANRLYLAQIKLGDALDDSGDPKAAFDAYTGSLVSIKRAIDLNGSEAVYFSNRRAAWVRIAKNRSKLDNNTAAFDAYTAAEEPARSAFDRSQSPEARAKAANWAYLLDVELGDLLVKQRNRADALARFAQGREWIDKAIAAAPQTSLYQGNLSALRLRMATQQRELRDGKAEETSLRDAVAAAELGAKLAVAGEPVAEQAARQVERMRAYNDLAAWHERQKDALAALAARRNALAAIERAAALAPGQASHQDALRAANRVIADHETAPVAADRAWRAAATAALRAVELAPSAERSNEAARSLFELGEQLATRSAWTPALSAYQAAAQQAQLAVKADPQAAENWLGLSVCQRQVALMLAKLPGREGEAVAVFESAMASGTNATERAPQNVQAWRSLYLARRDLALQLEQSGNPASARTQLGRAMQEADRALAINANDSTVQDEIDQLREDAKRLRPP